MVTLTDRESAEPFSSSCQLCFCGDTPRARRRVQLGAWSRVRLGVWNRARLRAWSRVYLDAQTTGSGVAAGRNHDVGRSIGVNLIFRCDESSRCLAAMVLIISVICPSVIVNNSSFPAESSAQFPVILDECVGTIGLAILLMLVTVWRW